MANEDRFHNAERKGIREAKERVKARLMRGSPGLGDGMTEAAAEKRALRQAMRSHNGALRPNKNKR